MPAPPRPLLDRLADKILVGDGCWEWTASRDGYGYGQVYDHASGRMMKAHRAAYEALVGPIPAGLDLDHLCRNRGCVRPDHLEPVTRGENVRRGRAGENMRSKTHCPQGHPYDEANTRLYRGRRYCRACKSKAAV